MLSVIGQLESLFSDDADVPALSAILQSRSMQALLKVYEQLRVIQRPPQESELQIQDVITLITQGYVEDSPEVDQLYSMISSSPHLSALLLCYDQVIRRDYGPSLADLDTSDMVSCHDEETMKVVRLVKSSEPLGATITRDDAANNIIFSRIFKGGPADRSGLIHVNDILVEVNNVPTKGKSPEEIIAHIASFQGPLIFRLIPGEPRSIEKTDDTEPIFVRAKFDFDPENDPQIPCIQAGIKFKKNDILRIVSRDDELWWQASIVDVGVHAIRSADKYQSNKHLPLKGVGLVPSSYLQNRREAIKMLHRPQAPAVRSATLERSFKEEGSSSLSRKKGPWTLLRRTFRSPKHRLGTSLSQLSPEFQIYDDSQHTSRPFVAYEEMVLHHHNSETSPRYRPLVLIGPQGVGRNMLKERLINSSPSRYGVPVPHTSRPQLPEEEDGKDYHFVSREFLERGILDNCFIEFGEYKGNLYGTSIAAVKAVMEDQQICVLAPYSQALKMLHNKDIKPFVIFIQPTSSMIINSTSAGVNQSLLTDEMEELLRASDKLQLEHGHIFDYTIIFKDADSALDELLNVAYMVANQPQWIPKVWN